jgi:hypothetical protein
MKRVIHFATVSALSASCAIASAAGLVQVDDEQLSDVSGQDGVYLNLKGFSLNSAEHFGYGPLKLTYTMPYEGASAAEGDPLGLDPSKPVNYIEYGKFSISRTDPLTEAEIFSDPYQIQIEKIPVLGWDDDSLAAYGFDLVNPTEEVIRLQNPKNANGSIKWDMTYDWKVVTGFRKDGLGAAPVTHDMGARIVDDLVIRGGGLSLAPALAGDQSPGDARGIAFGLDLNIEIGALILRPRGRDDASSELALRGIKIGAANDDRTGFHADSTKTWTVADVIMQPGILNAYTDANGKAVLRMGIEWYRGKVGGESDTDLAGFKGSAGAFSVDQIIIKGGTAAAPVMKDLGGLSVGGMEIRYLDVVFRNPY